MDSIYRGLCRIHDIYDDCVVLISDGTRPNVDGQLISSSIEKTLECGNAIGCKKCVETIGLLNDDNTICDILDRRYLCFALTKRDSKPIIIFPNIILSLPM